MVERLKHEVPGRLGVGLALPLFLPLREVGVLLSGESGLDDFGGIAHVCQVLACFRGV